MVVVDASAVLELLLATPAGERVARRVLVAGEELHAPHLLDVEVAHVVRRLEAAREIDVAEAGRVLADLLDLPLERHGHAWLLGRAFELRHAVTAYDAMYVALAEALDAPLVTADARLARAHGHRARVELVGSGR
jgi:predicted nucleic acid-binding protein